MIKLLFGKFISHECNIYEFIIYLLFTENIIRNVYQYIDK